jgi:hypothetical protein
LTVRRIRNRLFELQSLSFTQEESLLASIRVLMTLQGCFAAILLLFLPLQANSTAPGFRSPVSSARVTAAGSVIEGTDMSDRETSGLRGPVKICFEESISYQTFIYY